MHCIKPGRLKLLLGIIFIFLGLIIYTTTFSNNIIKQTVDFVTFPIIQFLEDISNSVSGFFDEIFHKKEKSLKEQIEVQKKEITYLRSLVPDYYEAKRENAQYEKYYGFKKNYENMQSVPASIVGRSPGELFEGFIIDKGYSSGVTSNCVVLTENGIVGRVDKASQNSATVLTLLSPDVKIGALNATSGDVGVVTGTLNLASKKLTSMSLISAQNSMKQEEIIVTSGLSGIYPKNLPIGKIKSVEYNEDNYSSYGVIEPFENNFSKLQKVFVITNFEGKGEINLR